MEVCISLLLLNHKTDIIMDYQIAFIFCPCNVLCYLSCGFEGDKYVNGEIIPCTYPTYQPNKRKESKYVSKRYERRRDGPPAERRTRQAAGQSESASS